MRGALKELKEVKSVPDELIFITGTSSGIGLASAIECAAAGFKVVATMRNLSKKDALLQAAADRKVSANVFAEALDVTSKDIDGKINELTAKYGTPFGLVNNAGIVVGGPFEEQSDAQVREEFETNVFGLFAATRALLPLMRARGRGRIVNISSLSGRVGFPLASTYAATKHAVEGFSEALRWELAPFGIQVCLIEPGAIKTPIFYDNLRRAALENKEGPYGRLSAHVEAMMMKEAESAPPPELVARALRKTLTRKKPAFRTLVGMDARGLVALRWLLPERVLAWALGTAFKPSRIR